MTGNDDAMIERHAVAAGGIAFLRKPFAAEKLLDAIEKSSRIIQPVIVPNLLGACRR